MYSANSKNISSYLCSALCVLCSLILFTGCASTEDVGRVSYNLNEVKSEIKDIKERVSSAAQKERLDLLEEKIQALQAAQESTNKNVSDLMLQIQTLASEFRILTGRFEESRYYSEKTSTEITSEKEKLSSKLKELELALNDLNKKLAEKEAAAILKEEVKPVEEKKPAEEVTPAEEKKTAEEAKPGEEVKKPQEAEKKGTEKADVKKEPPKPDVKDIYMAAYQAYKEGKTAAAREKFTTVLKDYPENEYSANARFWIGESYYKDGSYEDAILSYEEVIKKNPKSDKIPGALLKQGLSFYALKDEKTGRIILEKLLDQFPKSEQAQLAKKKLGKTQPKKK